MPVGVLIKGETDHYDLGSRDTHTALTCLGIDLELWIVNCVLACHDTDHESTSRASTETDPDGALELKSGPNAVPAALLPS